LPILLALNSRVQENTAPTPITVEQASAKVKEFLAEDRFRIQLGDFVIEEAEKLAQTIVGPDCPANAPGVTEDFIRQRIQYLEEASQVAISIFVTGCFWGLLPSRICGVAFFNGLGILPETVAAMSS
jgi:hypothetical protein